MADAPGWASESLEPGDRFRIGRRGLLVLGASLAITAWTGWQFWDTAIVTSARLTIRKTFDGNDSIRLLKSGRGTLDEKLTAVLDLSFGVEDDEIEEAIATLIAALDDDHVEVRTRAAHSLGNLVFEARSRGPEKPLDSAQLEKWTEGAKTVLLKGLSDQDPDFRVAVCMGLQMISSRSRAWHPSPQLSEALKRGTVKWTRATAKAYWGYADEAPPIELVTALNDESMTVRRAAVQTLAKFPLGLDSAIPMLFSMLEDSEPTIRGAAERTLLAAWPTSVVVPTLLEALKSKNHSVRFCAALMFNRIESQANEAVPLLIAILKEPLGSAPDEVMLRGFGSNYFRSLREAAIALGRIAPDETTIKLFVEMLSNGKASEPGIHERWIAASEGLCEIGPQARMAAPALIAAPDQLLDSRKPISKSPFVILGDFQTAVARG